MKNWRDCFVYKTSFGAGQYVYLSFSQTLFHRTSNAPRAFPPRCSWEGRRYCFQDISRTLWRCCSKSARSKQRYDSTWFCNRWCWPRRRRTRRAVADGSRSRRSLSSPPNNPRPRSCSLNYSPPPSCNRWTPSRRRSVPSSPGTDLKNLANFVVSSRVRARFRSIWKDDEDFQSKLEANDRGKRKGKQKKLYQWKRPTCSIS